ncbi:hypothetical protein [Achromobacter spanius]|uniref:Uncharacterized protein n=1 Tax=Achromobacter spanius TaxID=217203 RepID=A0AAW3I8B6_9BURK|nr:hypothetical protein [Achromobacter spanius]KNE28563.1 hypothetical protein AFM18_06810 [Achromobacter spanius]
MHADSYPEGPSRRLQIAPGASHTFVLRAGATIICMAGSLRLEEAAAGTEATGRLPLPVSVRVHASEAHAVVEGGVVRVTAIDAADIICLDVPDPISRILSATAKIFRLKSPKSSNKSLGALHKIS